jgi:flagellar hook-associated protein 1 FlgK
VNRALLADPTRLVVYQTSPLTPSGDTTRPNFLYDKLTKATLDYAPQAGVGTTLSPFSGSLPAYMRQIVSQQGEAATAAESLSLGQEIVYNSLNQRFSDGSAVNIDEEMANLLNLQNQYGANARVMTTIKEMLDLLMQM